MRILRLQDGQTADKILRDIKQNFDLFTDSENDFKVKNVEIISGVKEGLYCWIATNYLMDFIPEKRFAGTVGTLDMGGASAQIAFQVGASKPVNISPAASTSAEAINAGTVRNLNAPQPPGNALEASRPAGTSPASARSTYSVLTSEPATVGPNGVVSSSATTADVVVSSANVDSNPAPPASSALVTDEPDYKFNERATLFGQHYQINTFSNLCYGNDDARKRYHMLLILRQPESREVGDPCTHPLQLERIVDSQTLTADVCTYGPDGEQRQLPHPNYTFFAEPDVARCAYFTRQLVSVESVTQNFKDYNFQVMDKQPPKGMRFYAMSTFYFAAKQLRNREVVSFVDEQDFASSIQKYCSRTWADIVHLRDDAEHKYLNNFCFSVNYVFNYLKNVYRFKGAQFGQIEFRGKLAGYSLGWALGYMLQETNTIPGSGPKPPLIDALWFTVLGMFSAALLLFAAGSAVKQQILKKGEYLATQVTPLQPTQSRV